MRNPRSIALAVSAALLGVLVWSMAARPLRHDDVFFHMRTGELIANNWRVPHSDSFTHTMPGAPWITHEWGFGLLVYGVHRLGGFAGLVHLLQLLVLGLFALLYVAMRRSCEPSREVLIVPLLLVALGASQRSCFMLMAALCATVAMSTLCLLLQRWYVTAGRWDPFVIMAVILVWANLHASVLFGLALLGFHTLGAFIDQWRSNPEQGPVHALRGRPLQHAALTVACTALTLVNPNGIDLWRFPFKLNALLYHSGLVWSMGIFGSPSLAGYPLFYLLIALCFAACLPLQHLARVLAARRQPIIGQGLSLLFYLALALRSNRFILDFAVLASLFCASVWGRSTGGSSTRFAALLDSKVAHGLCAALVLGLLVSRPPRPSRLLSQRFPERATDFMRREGLQGNMFNPDTLGGYIGWRLRWPVYWDGRNDVFGPLARELAYSSDFGELVQRHKLEVLVMNETYYHRFNAYPAREIRSWGLVYFDDYTAIFAARVPKFAGVLAHSEYTLLRPFSTPSEVELRQVSDPRRSAQLDNEVTRVIRDNDGAQIGWYLRGLVAELRGDPHTAYRALRRAAQISEHGPVLYNLARVSQTLGHEDEARRWLTRALATVNQ